MTAKSRDFRATGGSRGTWAACCARNPALETVPVVMTCGAEEENIHNNRLMARTLDALGYDVVLHEVADLHNYTGWRDAFDPHLTGLLERLWVST